MKSTTSKSGFAISISTLAISLLLCFSSNSTTYGQTTTFAQFLEQNGSQDFVFTNNFVLNSSASFDTVGGGSPIFFIYSNIAGLDPSLSGFQNAHLFVSSTTTSPATLNGSSLSQPLNQTTTVQIIRDTPAPLGVGLGTRTHLLTAVFSTSIGTAAIVGSSGGNSATLSASTPDQTVTFTSDFLLFGVTTTRNLAFSFSSVTPSVLSGPGGFLQSFTAAASGTFASNPAPTPSITTTAAVVFRGQALSSAGMPVRNAQITLTESNGTEHFAQTNSFGYFSFAGIESGQNIIVAARSKQFHFTPKIVSLEDGIVDFSIYADY